MVAKRKEKRAAEHPKPAALSAKQQSLWAFLRRFVRENDVPPTLQDLRKANLGFSLGSLAYNLKALERMGYVVRLKAGGVTLVSPRGERAMKEAALWRLVDDGLAHWSGGKPKGSKRPVKLTPGPSISDLIIEERERLRS